MRVLKSAAVIGMALVASSLTSTGTAGAAEPAAESTLATRVSTPVISIAAKKDQVLAGGKVVLKGQVTDKRITRVKLQQKVSGKKWKNQGTAKVKKSGKYKIKDKTTTAVARKYRVKSATGPKKKSAKVKVGVFEWRDLTKQEVRTRSSWTTSKTIKIGGTSYGPAFYGYEWSESGLIDFNVGHECIALRARFGVSDDSDSNATAAISVVSDGTAVYTKSFGLTQSEDVTVALDKPFRVGITYVVPNPGALDPAPRAVAVAAQPEILCGKA